MDLSQEQTRNTLRLVGGVVLAVGAVLINVRKGSSWGDFPLFLVVALPCAVILWIAANAKAEDDRPQGWQSAYLVIGVILALISLIKFRQMLGSDSIGSGAQFWIFSLTAALAAYAAFRMGSAVNTLLAALAIAFAAVAFVDWVGSNPGYKTFRWVLVIEALAFLAAARSIRPERPAHSHYLVDAAGVTALLAGTIGGLATAVQSAVAAAFIGASSSGGGQEGNGWELFLLVTSLALIGYTLWQRYWGTAYLGFVGLLAFTALVGRSDSLKWWPIILVVAGVGAIAAGMGAGGVGASAGGRSQAPAAAAPPPPPPPPPPGPPEPPGSGGTV